VIWEALPTLKYVLGRMEKGINDFMPTSKKVKPHRLLSAIRIAGRYCPSMYNQLIDANHEIYIAATLLNPSFRKRYFMDE
jgi:hypothetical protein